MVPSNLAMAYAESGRHAFIKSTVAETSRGSSTHTSPPLATKVTWHRLLQCHLSICLRSRSHCQSNLRFYQRSAAHLELRRFSYSRWKRWIRISFLADLSLGVHVWAPTVLASASSAQDVVDSSQPTGVSVMLSCQTHCRQFTVQLVVYISCAAVIELLAQP